MQRVLEAVQDGLVVLVPLLVTWLAAELRRRIQANVVRKAVETVEDENWEECEKSKKARAVELVRQRTGAFTRMRPEKVGQLVEKALPKVREQNASRKPAPDRRTVDVTFKE